MDEELSFSLKIIAIVCFSVVIGIVSYEFFNHRHDENMAKLGYVQVLIPGKVDPIWQKQQ